MCVCVFVRAPWDQQETTREGRAVLNPETTDKRDFDPDHIPIRISTERGHAEGFIVSPKVSVQSNYICLQNKPVKLD